MTSGKLQSSYASLLNQDLHIKSILSGVWVPCCSNQIKLCSNPGPGLTVPLQGQIARGTAQTKAWPAHWERENSLKAKGTWDKEKTKQRRRRPDQDQTWILLLAFPLNLGQWLHIPMCPPHASFTTSPAYILHSSAVRLSCCTVITESTISWPELCKVYRCPTV